MVAPRKVDLDELANRLGGALPVAYRELALSESEPVLADRGFDPKTLLVLNLELRGWEHIDSNGRLFLNGDGCGNYYFTDLSAEADRVLLWSHDPPGTEDPDLVLAPYLREAEQLCRVDWPARPGTLYICRSLTYGESILEPIGMDEWLNAIGATRGITYLGYREGRNPFDGKTIRIESPGLARTGDNQRSYVSFHYGRAELQDSPEHRLIANQLAELLHARVQTADA